MTMHMLITDGTGCIGGTVRDHAGCQFGVHVCLKARHHGAAAADDSPARHEAGATSPPASRATRIPG